MFKKGILSFFVSDHFPVYVVRKTDRNTWVIEQIQGRSYAKYKKALLFQFLTEIDWEVYYALPNVDEKWSFICSILDIFLDIFCPIKSFTVKNTGNAWITPDLVIKMKETTLQLSSLKPLFHKTLEMHKMPEGLSAPSSEMPRIPISLIK